MRKLTIARYAGIALAACAAISVAAPMAGAQTYACKMKSGRNDSGVPENVVFEVLRNAGQVLVIDNYTYQATKRAVSAKVSRMDDKRVDFIWETGNLRGGRGNSLNIRLFGRYFVKKNKLNLRVDVLGFDNDPVSGSGKCEAVGGTMKDVMREIRKNS